MQMAFSEIALQESGEKAKVAEMEEMVIWEQYTVTLNRDPRKGFGIAISGGRDRPSSIDRDVSIVVSDVVPGGPADGRLQTRDKIAMVNGLSMDNVSSSFAIQTLKSCGRVANITVKRPRKVHLPVSKSSLPKGVPLSSPASHSSEGRNKDSDEDSYRGGEPYLGSRPSGYVQRQAEADHNRGYDGDSSSERSSGHYRDEEDAPHRQPVRNQRKSQDRGHRRWSHDSGSDRRPFTNGYGPRGNTGGLALMSGFKRLPKQDVPTKPTRQLIEQSEGHLTLYVLRDNNQFLVNIPEVRDSESESSHLDDVQEMPENDYNAQEDITVSQSGGYYGYSPDSKVVNFIKARSIGLRLAGGNDVGIFVAGVQDGSPAESQGIQEGDQILQVNERRFHNMTREEAVQFLMELPPGEEVTLHVQNKQDIYMKMVKSNVGDSFYIRTHFDFEKDTPSGLSFTRGEVFHVVDTMYRGKLGSWLAIRMGKELQEMDKGIVPNKSSSSGARAEFWKLRGLRGAKRNLRKSREDLSALTKQGHYPPYERVMLKEESVTREGGSAKVIKLDSVWQIAKQVDVSAEEGLDMLNQTSATSPGYLTCDSRANSDYEETDAEGEPYTDHELEEAYQEPALSRSSEPTERSLEQDLSERVAAALAYPVDLHDGDQQPQGQWQQESNIREYEHEALRKKFTQARAYDSESDQDYGYDWGPATDL
ncbi:hypothetical protein JD844_034041 [Phrynosoma platyrhinos]|uniref:PDZ domain-containing protein n=1 Tax=Phrynosoma platyrhinos TaxID=52577 RepID=A0ABQ7T992_PHRPL|nr:hypothetical protein JD844_034041 [Phrynosoma platyrhinos]